MRMRLPSDTSTQLQNVPVSAGVAIGDQLLLMLGTKQRRRWRDEFITIAVLYSPDGELIRLPGSLLVDQLPDGNFVACEAPADEDDT